ncbi:MAG: alanine--tRNA ligase-related protein [Lachnospiraceae bacterium]|nr:alanine--tRNA ligase-related protein [Lachnospiraceae bacterium]
MMDASTVLTEKLYDREPYAKEFSATVVWAEGDEVVLDRTLFFPEEGGQSPDTGRLNGREVCDVQIVDGRIHHYLKSDADAEPLKEGQTVQGELDWERRFSNMQQHSGEHLVSGIVNRLFGFDNVGFHLSDREVTLDFNGVIPEDRLTEIELLANRAIYANVECVIRFTTKEERSGLFYRSKLDLEGEVRLVEFPGYDVCACCAPHVRRTGEIGSIRIIKCVNHKGGVRMSILCGERAAVFAAEEHRIVAEAAGMLTTSADQICPQVRKLQTANIEMKGKLRQFAAKSLDAEIAAVDPAAEQVLLFAEDLEASAVRSVVNRLAAEHAGLCAVFIGTDEAGYSFVIGSGTAGGDAREAIKKMQSAGFAARGGGKPVMVQGSLQGNAAAIREVLQS